MKETNLLNSVAAGDEKIASNFAKMKERLKAN